jgi:hypothetical protein
MAQYTGIERSTVLTKTQLRTAKTAELERLQARIQEELDSRVQPDLQRLKRDQKTAKDQLFYSGHTGHYQWEYVACGNKERCPKCKEGIKHGPYLYRYFYKDGKQRSEYIKFSDLPKHPNAPPRPE